MNNDDTDWSLFRFPPPPPKRWGQSGSADELVRAPSWAAPPIAIHSWHFDDETIFIIHPKARKKIDLKRIITKRRLVKLCELIKTQTDPIDASSLFSAIDHATTMMFGRSLPDMLAFGPNEWSWPDHVPHISNNEEEEDIVPQDKSLAP